MGFRARASAGVSFGDIQEGSGRLSKIDRAPAWIDRRVVPQPPQFLPRPRSYVMGAPRRAGLILRSFRRPRDLCAERAGGVRISQPRHGWRGGPIGLPTRGSYPKARTSVMASDFLPRSGWSESEAQPVESASQGPRGAGWVIAALYIFSAVVIVSWLGGWGENSPQTAAPPTTQHQHSTHGTQG